MTDANESSITVRLGDEYDADLRRALTEALSELGGRQSVYDWGVGGSQELERFEVVIGGDRLTVEAETYVGLLLSGSESVVSQVKAVVERKMERV